MDGFAFRLKHSVRFRISLWLCVAIFAVATIAGISAFVSAFDEAHELQDDVLRQVATLLGQTHVSLGDTIGAFHSTGGGEESRVIVQYFTNHHSGEAGDGDTRLLDIPQNIADGIYTMSFGGESFRVLIHTLAAGRRVAVAQETGLRDEVATASAFRTVTPFLVLVPILLIIVAQLVKRMFSPIASLATDVDARKEQDLYPLSQKDIPVEVRPFVTAINKLLARVGQSMETQKRFIADAAHELRSPLTAFSLQAERLAQIPMSPQASERLADLRRGIERGRSQLDQLLTLARIQSAPAYSSSSVSVLHVYRRVLEDLMPLAEAKRIDIGIESGDDAQISANEIEIRTLVKNLVDNAIRYTPESGRVDLSVKINGKHVRLAVTDSGPGIAPAERAQVFEPFYRVLGSNQEGSGLGLRIVKTIADRLGWDVELSYSDKTLRSGLCVTVDICLESDRQSGGAEQ
ncbi:ATP-binding protein [Paraburkholderia sediminicola]|uniref:ATP-binding protein n=1 Tax=Paraburkholderia sediminicola TaxID=458836 RepID=UPI0038BC4AE2